MNANICSVQLPQDRLGKRGVSVLILDDDPDIVASLADLVEMDEEDYLLYTATSVDQASVIIAENHVDIALVDIKIGQQNGLEFVPALKAANTETSIIMMTAFRDVHYAAAAVKLGVSDYLFKPMEAELLAGTLAKYKKYTLALRNNRLLTERFKTVFADSFAGLLLFDSELRLLDINQSAAVMLDLDIDTITGCDADTLLRTIGAEDQSMKIMNALSDCMASGRVVANLEAHNRFFECAIQPLGHGDDNGIILLQLNDISASIKYRKYIEQVNINLEKTVNARTAELKHTLDDLRAEIETRKQAEAELIVARDLAEQASQAKSHFMSRASHQLRTPMNAILGFGQLLQVEDLDQRQLDSVSEIVSAGSQLLALIDDLLEISGTDSRNTDLNLTNIQIDKLVSECIQTLLPLWSREEVEIVMQDVLPATVRADLRLTRQILFNLLTNAIYFNKRGGFVFLSIKMLDTDHVRVSIIDSGAGISEQDQQRIFEPFVRLDPTRNKTGNGTGLTVARKLAEYQGGQIGVFSSHAGSTFWLDFPAA
ncbi:MAG: hybrid sensor histidine kinase/response regulator [Gammaproteobacteria bacterium]|nr:hybrid sensor histidine kinase/response regulator [Gammaproteobacteria bacterium]